MDQQKKPSIVFVIGNRGSGKSTLCRQICEEFGNNITVIAADEVHSGVLGYEECMRQVLKNGKIVMPKEAQAEGTRKVNAMLMQSIEKGENILLDASFSKNHEKFIRQLQDIGYYVEVRGMVTNKYVAAYNVEKRFMDFAKKCREVSSGLAEAPKSFNTMDVGYQVPLAAEESILGVIGNVEAWGIDLSLYRYQEKKPAYQSVRGKSIDGRNRSGVDFYEANTDTNYALLYSNILKLEKEGSKWGRDISALKTEVTPLAKPAKRIAIRPATRLGV